MRKVFIFLLIAMVGISSLLVSCKADAVEESLPQGVVGVSMSVDAPKAISMSVNDGVAVYEYRALPQFDLTGEDYNDGIFGEQQTWRVITVRDYKASLGYYRQGLWVFELRTKNANGEVLTTGVSDPTYLQKGKENVVRITLKQDDGEGRSGENFNTGRIVFGFESNMLDSTVHNLDHAYIRIEADKLDTEGNIDTRYQGMRLETSNACGLTLAQQGTNGFISLLPGTADPDGLLSSVLGDTVAQARVRYYAATPELYEDTKTVIYEGTSQTVTYWAGGVKAGQYILRIKQCVMNETTHEEIVIAGQAVAIKVVGGETTTVIGTLVPEKYINTSLLLTVARDVDGDIAADGNTFIIRSDDLSHATLTLQYVPDDEELSQYTTLDYRWYVNGVYQANETSSTFAFTPDNYGDAKITCYANGHVGPNTYFGKQASVTQIVNVRPSTGPNVTGYQTDPSF